MDGVLPDLGAFPLLREDQASGLLPSPPMLRAVAVAVAVAIVLVAALPAGAATRIAPLTVPTGAVTGTLRASWTEASRADPVTRTDATITFTIEDRLRSPGAAEA